MNTRHSVLLAVEEEMAVRALMVVRMQAVAMATRGDASEMRIPSNNRNNDCNNQPLESAKHTRTLIFYHLLPPGKQSSGGGCSGARDERQTQVQWRLRRRLDRFFLQFIDGKLPSPRMFGNAPS